MMIVALNIQYRQGSGLNKVRISPGWWCKMMLLTALYQVKHNIDLQAAAASKKVEPFKLAQLIGIYLAQM
jgi:hypothetical protein